MESNSNIFEREIERYYIDGGNESLRFNYQLDKKSIVFDVGGYIGDFSYVIHKKFRSKIFLFEPVKSCYSICLYRFSSTNSIILKNYGISGSTGESKIFIDGDKTSSHLESEHSEVIETKTLKDAMNSLNVKKIDLLKLNIEGDEYDLLEKAIEDKCISKIKNIQIQFHMNVDNYEERKEKITKELEKTHILQWKYDWVWESWKIKQKNDRI
jgi:FkbM family methyltransferase